MTPITELQAKSRAVTPNRMRGRRLGAVAIATVMVFGAPAAASAADTISAPNARAPYEVAFLGAPSHALTPGMPPPHFVARASDDDLSMSTRTLAAGTILVLFAALAALTLSMWRDLGQRLGAR